MFCISCISISAYFKPSNVIDELSNICGVGAGADVGVGGGAGVGVGIGAGAGVGVGIGAGAGVGGVDVGHICDIIC